MPARVGVPVRTPVAINKLRPNGKLPVARPQVLAGLPEATKVVLYAAPTVPDGGVLLVIRGATVAAVGVPLSATAL